ncbi:MAG: KilA-N domain-containing protein [Bacillota bacterium]
MASKILVQGIEINYRKINENDYISLIDIAKNKNLSAPADVVKNWMRTRSALEYMCIWEKFYNPEIKEVEIDHFISETGSNSFTMSPTKWIESTNAIGIISKLGRNGGVYAHKDIAFKFASWVSAEFEFYLIQEFQRLKQEETKHIEWSAKRELAKLNYAIHTDAIKENLIIPKLSKSQISYVYASEADVLNVALFGKTAGEWRTENKGKKGNIRDFATLEQLLILANMESYNALLIEQELPQSDRLQALNKMAISQMKTLEKSNSWLLSDGKPKK